MIRQYQPIPRDGVLRHDKSYLRALADQAYKQASRKRKHKIIKVIPEGETGGKVTEWNERTFVTLKKLGKRKAKAKLIAARLATQRELAMDTGIPYTGKHNGHDPEPTKRKKAMG